MLCPDQMAGGKADSFRTNLSCVGFPGHEAAAGVDVPRANVSATAGAEQQGVRVVAQRRHLHIPDLSWRFRPLRLQRAKTEPSVPATFRFKRFGSAEGEATCCTTAL